MKFPDKLYAKIEKDGDNHYIISSEDLDAHALVGEKIKIGVYQLVEVCVLKTVTELGKS